MLAGIERLRDACGIDPSSIVRFIFGTTVATNAVLEHKGARTALVATSVVSLKYAHYNVGLTNNGRPFDAARTPTSSAGAHR